MTQLPHAESLAVVVTNNVAGEEFRIKGGAKEGYPLRLCSLIIVIELMAIEMRSEEGIKGIVLKNRAKNITSISNKKMSK